MSNSTAVCPACEQGTLTEATYTGQFQYNRDPTRLFTAKDLEYHKCDQCDGESVSPAQIRRNERRVADAKRRYIGLLTSTEIKRIRKKLGVSQQQAAAVFGGGDQAFSKYERGEVVQSEAMDKLLRVVVGVPQAKEYLMRMVADAPSPECGAPTRGNGFLAPPHGELPKAAKA